MSMELGMVLAGLVVVLTGVGMAGFLVWLRNRESNTFHKS